MIAHIVLLKFRSISFETFNKQMKKCIYIILMENKYFLLIRGSFGGRILHGNAPYVTFNQFPTSFIKGATTIFQDSRAIRQRTPPMLPNPRKLPFIWKIWDRFTQSLEKL